MSTRRSAQRPWRILLTCEHGGAQVPARWRPLFRSAAARRALASHRGSDIGALRLARRLSEALHAPLVEATVTRLLIELNRSPGHPRLWSEFTKGLPAGEKQLILGRHYRPHRTGVEAIIAQWIADGARVAHIGVHSFTPSLNGVTRTADLGLLYDPLRAAERTLCDQWIAGLRTIDPSLRVRRNYPYLGTADGLTTFLRRRFRVADYAGVELEVSQEWLARPGSPRRRIESAVITSALAALPRGV